MGKIKIRAYSSNDIKQASSICSILFDNYLFTDPSGEELTNFLIDAGIIPRYSPPGFFVAEENGNIAGIIVLKWKSQKKPRVEINYFRILRSYGFVNFMKLFIRNTWHIFPQKSKIEREICYGDYLAVDIDKQGKNIGSLLLEYGLNYARQNGFKKFALYVPSSNKRLIDWYKGHGFKIERNIKSRLVMKFVTGTNAFTYMTLDL